MKYFIETLPCFWLSYKTLWVFSCLGKGSRPILLVFSQKPTHFLSSPPGKVPHCHLFHQSRTGSSHSVAFIAEFFLVTKHSELVYLGHTKLCLLINCLTLDSLLLNLSLSFLIHKVEQMKVPTSLCDSKKEMSWCLHTSQKSIWCAT